MAKAGTSLGNLTMTTTAASLDLIKPKFSPHSLNAHQLVSAETRPASCTQCVLWHNGRVTREGQQYDCPVVRRWVQEVECTRNRRAKHIYSLLLKTRPGMSVEQSPEPVTDNPWHEPHEPFPDTGQLVIETTSGNYQVMDVDMVRVSLIKRWMVLPA